MNEQQFAYWLNGFAELNQQPPTPEQWKSIREHLATVFKKVTPALGSPAIPDMKDNPSIKEMLKRAKKANWIEPSQKYYQPYFLDSPYKPGTVIC